LQTEPDHNWTKPLWALLVLGALGYGVWYYRPALQKGYSEWQAAQTCPAPGPGVWVYVRKADLDNIGTVALAERFHERGFPAMCGNMYGNSAVVVGPFPGVKEANAAFWNLGVKRSAGDYIRLLKVSAEDGGTWSDPYPVTSGKHP
jgi:hypothetical protein